MSKFSRDSETAKGTSALLATLEQWRLERTNIPVASIAELIPFAEADLTQAVRDAITTDDPDHNIDSNNFKYKAIELNLRIEILEEFINFDRDDN